MGTDTEIIRRKWLLSTEQWLHGLGAAFVTGAATAIMGQGGLGIMQSAGTDMKPLDLKQLLVFSVSAGVFGAAAYLKQSPLPKVPPGTEVTVESTKVTTTTVTPVEPPPKTGETSSTPGLP